MEKVKGGLQLLASVICLLVAAAVIHNLSQILMRPESVSVVNALVGQSVLIICLLAAARILSKKGLSKLRSVDNPSVE